MFDFLKSKEQESESLPTSSHRLDDESPQAEMKTEDDFSDDPVDKIFSFFFGTKEESPMGLKRFGRENFPEQYPGENPTAIDFTVKTIHYYVTLEFLSSLYLVAILAVFGHDQ